MKREYDFSNPSTSTQNYSDNWSVLPGKKARKLGKWLIS